MYDVLNNIALDSLLQKAHSSERELALEHVKSMSGWKKVQKRSLLLFDRGYFSLEMFFSLTAYDLDFVFRMPRNSYKEIKELFEKDCKIDSKQVQFTL
jgi:hypothetical protein